MDHAVCLLSGGQDSTTSLYWALNAFDSVHALIINYGQRHSIEIQSAKMVATLAGVGYDVLDLDFFSEIGNSSLLNGFSDVNQDHECNKDLPSSFVPGRNLIFITVAAMVAYKKGFKNVVTGVCQTDYSGYPDCRHDTIRSLRETIELGMGFNDFCIHTPLMSLTKKETVDLANELPGCMDAMMYSHTCYNGKYPPCGTCSSCILRKKGFDEAGVTDPLYIRR